MLLGIPFWVILVTAAKDQAGALNPNLALPDEWHLFENFGTVFTDGKMLTALGGSVLVMVPAVIGVLLLGSMAAWILGRRVSKGLAVVYAIAISGIVLPPAVVTIVLLLRQLGLAGTAAGMIGVYMGMYLATVIFFVTGFIRTIPIELEEAARVDGASPVRVFFTIIVPLLMPVLATATILICLYIWNDVFYALFVVGGRLDTLPAEPLPSGKLGALPSELAPDLRLHHPDEPAAADHLHGRPAEDHLGDHQRSRQVTVASDRTPRSRMSPTPKPATIADVAARAGVSVPTVSRVLTGAARVTPEKRERVDQAIAELNFRPSAAARVLASRKAQVIAVIAGDTSRYGYAETIRGIEESARADGYTVMITVVESADDDEIDRAIAATLSQPLAGVVVLKFDPPGVAALQRVPDDLPLVILSGVRDTSLPQAVLDESHAAEELTDYLLGLGHKTVHHVRIPPSRKEDGRTTGWRRALRRAGASIPEPFDATWEPKSGQVLGTALAADRGRDRDLLRQRRDRDGRHQRTHPCRPPCPRRCLRRRIRRPPPRRTVDPADHHRRSGLRRNGAARRRTAPRRDQRHSRQTLLVRAPTACRARERRTASVVTDGGGGSDGVFGEHLVGDRDGTRRTWKADVEREVGDHLLQLVVGEPVAPAEPQMPGQLLGGSIGDEGGEGDEAAVAGRQFGAVPDVAQHKLFGDLEEFGEVGADRALGGSGLGHEQVLSL